MRKRTRGLVAAAIGVIAVALLIAVTLGDAATSGAVRLTVVVRGHGHVQVSPGEWSCSRRCSRRLAAGATITLDARPGAGDQLVQWSGACVGLGNGRCTFRLPHPRVVGARFAPLAALVSWNHFYKCKLQRTTIPFILGFRQNARQGATEAGGGFQPHLRGGFQQHLLNPPCSIAGTGTFVEIHDVVVAGVPERSADGDLTVDVTDPNRPDIKDVYMKTLEIEIDNLLGRHHVAPPIEPPKGTAIDIQGFVFWDPAHTTARWHSFSGWEIHTVTAWRRATHKRSSS